MDRPAIVAVGDAAVGVSDAVDRSSRSWRIGRLAGFAVAWPGWVAFRWCEPVGHGRVSDSAEVAVMDVTADRGPWSGCGG